MHAALVADPGRVGACLWTRLPRSVERRDSNTVMRDSYWSVMTNVIRDKAGGRDQSFCGRIGTPLRVKLARFSEQEHTSWPHVSWLP